MKMVKLLRTEGGWAEDLTKPLSDFCPQEGEAADSFSDPTSQQASGRPLNFDHQVSALPQRTPGTRFNW